MKPPVFAFKYRTVTVFGSAFHRILLALCRWRADPVSLAATQGVAVAFLSSGYLDVSVHRVVWESWDQCLFDGYPKLIAAFHAQSSDAKTSPVRPSLLDHPHSELREPEAKAFRESND